MCGFKCFGFFTIYIIIEYLLILMCFFQQHSALFVIVKLTLRFSIGVSIGIIIIGFCIWILCCKKISLTYFYITITIEFCEMFIFLHEIEHRYYELLFVTPFIFYFLQFSVYYGAKKLESPEEQENNSDHSIPNSITREMLQWPFIESGLYEFYDIDTARNSVLSQPPSYDEVMKKDSKVMIIMESDTEPPSYSQALWGENISQW